MTKPDKIWVGPYVDDKGVSWENGHWDSALADGSADIEYLLSTPAREHAEALMKAANDRILKALFQPQEKE